jgi:hypothetical protein
MAMAGPRIDYPLPMLCTPHKFNFAIPEKKTYIASFIGSYTHPLRATMVDQLKDKEGYYISTRHHDLREYCQVMSQSKYALCPRGYGQSSFRIQEAIDFGAIPIYISDEHIFPYNQGFLYGYAIDPQDDYINWFEKQRPTWNSRVQPDKSLFTYAGCKREILNYLSNEQEKHNRGGNTELQ